MARFAVPRTLRVPAASANSSAGDVRLEAPNRRGGSHASLLPPLIEEAVATVVGAGEEARMADIDYCNVHPRSTCQALP